MSFNLSFRYTSSGISLVNAAVPRETSGHSWSKVMPPLMSKDTETCHHPGNNLGWSIVTWESRDTWTGVWQCNTVHHPGNNLGWSVVTRESRDTWTGYGSVVLYTIPGITWDGL